MTVQRLTGARLTHIREPLTWSFKGSTVLIENEGQPIPADLADILVGEGFTPAQIEASWHLDELAGTLQLADIEVDDEAIAKEVTIPISPAGHVRVDLGSRQYNIHPGSVENPGEAR